MSAEPLAALLAAPHDPEAEMSVLGAMMTSATACGEVLGLLTADAFYLPAHHDIFTAVVAVFAEVDGPPDPIAVHDWLRRQRLAERCGGAPYLHSLISSTLTARNVSHWAAIVAEHHRSRQAQTVCTRALQRLSTGESADPVLHDAAQALADVLAGGAGSADVEPLADVLTHAMADIAAVDADPHGMGGVPTGLGDLDHALGGLRRGQLLVVGGRPAMGKSLLLAQTALHAARQGHPVLYVSLEMAGPEVAKRALAAAARVPLDRLVKGGLHDADWARLAAAQDELSLLPLDMYCSGQVTAAQVRAQAHRLRLRYPTERPCLIAVDYLQLLHTPGRVESRQVEVSANSRALKALAQDLDGIVVAASQLNRGPESRAVSVPRLADLRESGAVEQDSDVVVLLHREDYYDPTARAGEIDLHVAKNRNGATAKVTCAFLPHYGRIAGFGDL